MPRRLRLEGTGKRGSNAPSRCSGAGCWRAARAHHEQRHVRACGGQRQSSCGHEIERLGIAPWLDQHGAEGRTARRLLACPQHGWPIARAHKDQPLRRQAQLGKARGINLTHLQSDEILPHPDDGPPLRGAQGEGYGKGGGGRFIRHAVSKNLMQGGPHQPPADRRIDRVRPRPEPRRGNGGRPSLKPGDLISQGFQIDTRHDDSSFPGN